MSKIIANRTGSSSNTTSFRTSTISCLPEWVVLHLCGLPPNLGLPKRLDRRCLHLDFFGRDDLQKGIYSSTKEPVCSPSELLDFGFTSCNSGVPSERIADVMKSLVLFSLWDGASVGIRGWGCIRSAFDV